MLYPLRALNLPALLLALWFPSLVLALAWLLLALMLPLLLLLLALTLPLLRALTFPLAESRLRLLSLFLRLVISIPYLCFVEFATFALDLCLFLLMSLTCFSILTLTGLCSSLSAPGPKYNSLSLASASVVRLAFYCYYICFFSAMRLLKLLISWS